MTDSQGTRAVVVKNAAALYAVLIISYLIPILEIPILARSLGPDLYGELIFCQALALTLSIFVEYGFNINASRQVALLKNNREALSRLFWDITLAKWFLFFIISCLIFLVWLLFGSHVFFGHSSLLWFVLAYFSTFGFSVMWYFQGRENLGWYVVLDVFLRGAGLAVLALVIRTPEDFLLALPIMAIPPLLHTLLGNFCCIRNLGFSGWRLSGAWRELVEGFPFFIYRSAGDIILASAPMLLGLLAGKRAVGEFAPSEKLVRGMTRLATPFLTAAFPFFSRKFGSGDKESVVSVVRVLGVIFILALLVASIGFALGDWALTLMLGPGFSASLSIFYVLLLMAPLRIMNQSVAMLLLIPADKARTASYLLLGSSAGAILLGTVLAYQYGGIGMAAGLLAGELILFLAQIWYAWKIVGNAAAAKLSSGKGQVR